MSTTRPSREQRKGNILVLSAVLMVPLCGVLAFALDLGYIYVKKAELQSGADAAALAAAAKMNESVGEADEAAINLAMLNCPDAGNVLHAEDIEYGDWDSESRSFVPSTSGHNAVRVTLKRLRVNSNPVSLFFARVIGQEEVELVAEATALPPPQGAAFQFLIDDEMIDSDEKDIEDLAGAMGIPPEDLISDLDGDGFIDLPPGSVLELPTGQVGDEGMFDIASFGDSFPFQENSDYTSVDFIAEGTALESLLATRRLQDVEWNGGNAPHNDLVGSKLLDPTPGVDPMDSHSEIAALPNPDQVYVSPVFDDDVSMAETDLSKYGAPAANLQGERRGLLVYKIIASRPNPAGGSYLPMLTIEILDPSSVDIQSLEQGSSSSSSGGSVVSLVQ